MSKRNRESDYDDATSSKARRMKTDHETHSTLLTNDDYTVGWICALPKEQTAATAMLDQRHSDLSKPPNDPNTYTLGCVGKHNIVIACLPKGKIGTHSAATVAAWMVSTFPSIKFGLMVGIGGGIPPKVRLGDVVVSTSIGSFPGVVQWDFGKAKEGGNFERTGSLNNPPTSLLTALTKLETEHELVGSKIPEYLDELKQKWPRLATKYLKSDSLEDILFRTDYGHVSESATDQEVVPDDGEGDDEEENCRLCDKTKVVTRKARDMSVHYGLIASGNQVIKDAAFRDKLNKDLGRHVLCVEMEAAGLMNDFPCIVIRGICDYADSHKNKDWQEHAAAVAAAFAKVLLQYVQPRDVEGERPVKDLLKHILKQVHDDTSATRGDVTQIKSKLNREEDREILNWLTAVDYGPQQSDYLKSRQPGTGQWVLKSTEFQDWLATDKQTLFCPGIPGAGKTILTSIVVDYLNSRFWNNLTTGIAYIYCNFQRHNEQNIEHLLASVLKQLAEAQPSLPGSIKSLYDQHKAKRTRPPLDDILRALQSVLVTYPRVFIIVDALDECQASDGCRKRFLSELFTLQVKHGINIFATSRFIPEIIDYFKASISLEIHASTDDVAKYLKDHMEQLPSRVQQDSQLQEEIIAGISEAVDGMFLLARIYFGLLHDKLTRKDIRSQLEVFRNRGRTLGEDQKVQVLAHAYGQAMERINGQMPGLKKLAIEVLSWITCAKRRLTTTELHNALAVEEGHSELDEDNLPQIEDMVSVCAGLVTVDEDSGIIRLVHYTAQEFFERTRERWFPRADEKIMTTCVTYLSFNTFESGICATNEKFENRLLQNPLYEYAARNWGHHARRASAKLSTLTLNFLKNEAKVFASSQAMFASKRFIGDPDYAQRVPKQMTCIHLASYFGLVDAVVSLEIGHDLDARNSDGRTPLSLAAENGHDPVVNVLLNKNGIDINIQDSLYRRTPLSWAAGNGHYMVVKMLLSKNGVDGDSKDSGGRTPLSWAAENGHSNVVKLLLAKDGVIADSKSTWFYKGRTPLSWAAVNGHVAVVELLLETKRVDPDFRDYYGRTSLSYVAEHGHEGLAKLLLGTGRVDPESKDSHDRTPLSYVAEHGHEGLAKLLLGTGRVDADSKDSRYQTPLWWAFRNGHEGVLTLLLATRRIDPNLMGQNDQTPLLWAAEKGKEVVVKLLLENGAGLECKDNKGQTPLSFAAEKGHKAVVRLLLENGADLECKDSKGRAPLSFAAENGHEGVVKLLIEKCTDLESKDNNGRTPLWWGVEKGHEAMVKLLIEKGADLESKDNNGWTPLLWAAVKGYNVVVKLLLEKGADLECKDNNGQTLLLWAVEKDYREVLRLLLKNGADLECKDNNGRTPLSWAAEKGHRGAVKLLLKKGADLESKDNNGRTPLSWAAEKGHWGAVKLLLEMGADLESKDNNSRTPLSWAAENRHLFLQSSAAAERYMGAVKLLLENGADLECKDNNGRTPLSWAAVKGHNVVVKLLLEKGADLECKDNNGRTPLSCAAAKCHKVAVKLLLKKGADLESKDNTGRTPLSWAAEVAYGGAVKLLLEEGADLESKDNNGRSPLSWAVVKDHIEAAKILLKNSINLEPKGDNSQTLLLRAAEKAYRGAVKLLLEEGADLESKDNNGRTPLSWAAEMAYRGAVKLLLEEGADLESKDNNGRTPLSWAAAKGHEAVVKLLLEKGADLESKDNNSRTPLLQAATLGHGGATCETWD